MPPETIIPPVVIEPPITTEPPVVIEPPRTYTQEEFLASQKRASDYELKVKEFEKKIKDDEIKKLENKNQWQEVSKIKEAEAAEANANLAKFKNAFIHTQKMTAMREEALRSKIRKESLSDLSLLDFPELQIQTDSEGDVKVSGADKAIQRLKTLRPHWFESGAPNVNTNSPTVTSGSNAVTYEDVKKAQEIARKTGNYEDYKTVILKFKEQGK